MPISFTCPHCGQQMNVADDFAGQTGPCSKCGQTITIPSFSAPPPAARRSAAPWIIILVVLAVGLVLVVPCLLALLLPAIQAARESGRQVTCKNNLSNIALAMYMYEQNYGQYPPAYVNGPDGKPWHSWRVLILPYLERQDLYDRYNFNEPWNGPNNKQLASQMPALFRCPTEGNDSEITNYAVVVGEHTPFRGDKSLGLGAVSARDGSPNTLLVVETAGADIHWMEPRDLDFDRMTFRINDPDGKGLSGHHPGGVMVSFCDRHVSFINEDVDPDVIKALITADGREPISSGF